jgi:short-subunit dehydrogenase
MSKTALITGASGGIGYELALLFARDGFDCILVARSHDKLNDLAARLESEFRVKTLVLPKDLSKTAAVDEICEEVSAASMQVDVLVNNAGFPSSACSRRPTWKPSSRCCRSTSWH